VVVPFPSARARSACKLIDALGARAGVVVGLAARVPSLPAEERRELEELADEIERLQGYRWYFASEN
jgi:hypothetical protein